MGELVDLEYVDDVAVITMDDGKVNALSPAMWSALNDALDHAESNSSPVVIAGRAGIFSGGFDLKVLRSGGAEANAMLDSGFGTAERLLAFRAPVVAAVTGHAIAMGAFLVCSCNYRVGVDGPFRLVANEVTLGMTMPYGIVELCRLRLAPTHLVRALTMAEPFEGVAAVQAGFLDEVTAQADVVTVAVARARAMTELNRGAFVASKQRVYASALVAIRAGFERDSLERAEMMGQSVSS
jgi:enoyl-CoA hydratase